MTAAIAAALILLALMVLPGNAETECAWVLWTSFEPGSSKESTETTLLTKWRRVSTHADRQACEALAEKMAKSWDDGREGTGATRMRVRCLPDTVDPRGPKGGAR